MIFHVSHDGTTRDGETFDEHNARLAKNVDHQRRRDAEAARRADEDGHSSPCWGRNLEEEFDMMGDQPVHQTPSANLAIGFNELEKLPQTPEVKKVRVHIIAAQV
jgi:hypothetical protein